MNLIQTFSLAAEIALVNFRFSQSLGSPPLCPVIPSAFLGGWGWGWESLTSLLLEASGHMTQTHRSLPPPWGCPGLSILEALGFSLCGFAHSFQEAAELWGRAQTWPQSLPLPFHSYVTFSKSPHLCVSMRYCRRFVIKGA